MDVSRPDKTEKEGDGGGGGGYNKFRKIKSIKKKAGNEWDLIVYIYHALINALGTHMIHINLNMIFYTHVEHSPTKTVYIKYYKRFIKKTTKTHTHTQQKHYKNTHTHTHMYTHMHTHTHTHTCACAHTYTVAEIGYWYYLGWKYCKWRYPPWCFEYADASFSGFDWTVFC